MKANTRKPNDLQDESFKRPLPGSDVKRGKEKTLITRTDSKAGLSSALNAHHSKIHHILDRLLHFVDS